MVLEALQPRPGTFLCSAHKSKQFVRREIRIALLTLIPLLIILTFRDSVLDTYAYVIQFNEIPSDWDSINFNLYDSSNGIGFVYFAAFVKILFQCDHYLWFFILASINLLCITRVCVKHSPNLALSIFLFIAATTFTWCLNGSRQFLVATILFYFSYILYSNKVKDRIKYILLIFVLSYVHSSALFLIPIVAVISSKSIFGKNMMLIVIATLIGTYFSDTLLGSAMEIVGKDYPTILEEGAGSSILRLLFLFVPIVIAIFNYNRVKQTAPSAIVLGINMCLVGACFMFVSTFTNGILIGRMPGYFNIYSLYVLPWLIYNCFPKNQKFITLICVLVYIVWFYFQMVVAWHDLPYGSNFLDLHYD